MPDSARAKDVRPPGDRPLRRDARRNREQIIAAARRVFAERGLKAPLEEIARQAGVSIGTLYNRFPSRADLVDAVFADRVATVVEIAGRALAMDDPWGAFVHFIERVCEMQANDRGYSDVMCYPVPAAVATEENKRRGYAAMQRVIRRAQDAGALRDDVTLEDMAFIMWGHARTVEAAGKIAPDLWRRHLGLLLDGLRAPAATPLPRPPLTPEQAARAMGGMCESG